MTKFDRLRHFPPLALAGALMAITTTGVIYSPTLYRLFCAVTGYGGAVQRATTPAPVQAAATDKVTVFFDANVAPGLPWEFRPEQRKVEARFGEPVQVYYYAKNDSDETIVARAAFNVTPFVTAPYFFKLECFCFTEEKLRPGESARMPLVLYVDQQMLRDPDTKEIREITLSYTFYRQTGLSPEQVQSARNLKAGSAVLQGKLRRALAARFDNDAPRR